MKKHAEIQALIKQYISAITNISKRGIVIKATEEKESKFSTELKKKVSGELYHKYCTAKKSKNQNSRNKKEI